MKLSDFFAGNGVISEGQNDKNFRKLAQFVVTAVEKSLQQGREPDDVMRSRGRRGEVEAWYLGEKMPHPPILDDLFKNLVISFVSVPGRAEKASFFKTVGYDILRVYRAGTNDVTPEEWKFAVWQDAANWWKESKQDALHELIHMMDFRRAGMKSSPEPNYDPAAMAKHDPDPQEVEKYVHDNWEWNAIIQEEFMNLDQYLEKSGATTWEQAQTYLGKTAQEFYKKIFEAIGESFTRHFTEEDRKKLAKRTYQYWNDARTKYSQQKT